MLTYISSHPTAAVEIATPSARNDVVIFGWSFCFGWVVIANHPYGYACSISSLISAAMDCISSRSALMTMRS